MSTLLIVGSPFQTVCAVEAIQTFSVVDPFFIILSKNDSENAILPLIKGYQYQVVSEGNGTIYLIRWAKNMQLQADKVFVGDYFSYSQCVIASIMCKPHSLVTYLDDGNSTITLNPPVSNKRYKGFKKGIKMFPFIMLEKLKQIRNQFFSIFDIDSSLGFVVVPNKFNYLRNSSDSKEQRGVFVIGTNPNMIHIQGKSYSQILQKTIEDIKSLYPHDDIYYCKHRLDNTDYGELFRKLQVVSYNTVISVEVDFCRNKENPLLIVGFGSTALLTLKILFPQSVVATLSLERIGDSKEKYRIIEDYYQKYGVMINKLTR